MNTTNARDDNPYNELGFGFVAYFRMIWCYTLLFSLFSVMILPVMFIYKGHDGFGQNSRVTNDATYSLGNMGFSDADCLIQYAVLPQNRTLTCAVGKFTELNYMGIIPDSMQPEDKGGAYCGSAETAKDNTKYGNLTNITDCSYYGLKQNSENITILR